MLTKELIKGIRAAVNHPSKVDISTFDADQSRAGREAVSILDNGLLLVGGDKMMNSSICVANPHLYPILFREVLKQINMRYGVDFDLSLGKGYIYESVAHELGHAIGCINEGLTYVMGIQVVRDKVRNSVGVIPFVRMNGSTSRESVIAILQGGEQHDESELSSKDIAMIDTLRRT